MSKDDLELLTRAFELLNSEQYEQALPLIDERFEMVTTPEVASEPDTYRGRDGVRRWWESFLEAMDSVRLTALRMHPVDRAGWSSSSRSTLAASAAGSTPCSPGSRLATVRRRHAAAARVLHRPRSGASRRATSVELSAPSRRTAGSPPASVAVRSTTVEGDARPAGRRRWRDRRRPGSRRRSPRRRRAAARPSGWPRSAGSRRRRRSAALDQAPPSRSGSSRQASG